MFISWNLGTIFLRVLENFLLKKLFGSSGVDLRFSVLIIQIIKYYFPSITWRERVKHFVAKTLMLPKSFFTARSGFPILFVYTPHIWFPGQREKKKSQKQFLRWLDHTTEGIGMIKLLLSVITANFSSFHISSIRWKTKYIREKHSNLSWIFHSHSKLSEGGMKRENWHILKIIGSGLTLFETVTREYWGSFSKYEGLRPHHTAFERWALTNTLFWFLFPDLFSGKFLISFLYILTDTHYVQSFYF